MANVEHKNLTGANLHEPKGVSGASANTVYLADGGGSGTWQKYPASSIDTTGSIDGDVFYSDGAGAGSWSAAPGGTFGEMRAVSNVTATTLTLQSTWYKVTAGVSGVHLNGFTFLTDHLVVPTNGWYRIDGYITLTSPNANTIAFGVSTDGTGTGIMSHISRHTATSATDVYTLPLNFIHNFSVSDGVYIMIQNETAAGTTATITDCVLTASLLKEV